MMLGTSVLGLDTSRRVSIDYRLFFNPVEATMEKLRVVFPGGHEVHHEIRTPRAKELYLCGVITREGPGKYRTRPLNPEEVLDRIIIALLDLQGDYL